MKNLFLTAALLAALIGLLPHATTAKEKKVKKIPTAQFRQYGLDPGPVQSQVKSDIEVSLKVIRISDIYQYPDMFAFNLEDVPYERDFLMTLNRMYPKGPLGKSWENPFSTQDGTEQLLICQAKVKNNTEHILRMKDARIYLIIEGEEPVAALSNLAELLKSADYFEVATNRYLLEQSQKNQKKLLGGFLKVQTIHQLPNGFYRNLVLQHKNAYKLINSLDKEILPGYPYEGLLMFPSVVISDRPAKIAFFNVITKTDAAGNPTEKTQFEFTLLPQQVSMWYDTEEMMWKEGVLPGD